MIYFNIEKSTKIGHKTMVKHVNYKGVKKNIILIPFYSSQINSSNWYVLFR